MEISRARYRAELVTDDRNTLLERLEAATGERVAALEAIGPERGKAAEAARNKAHEREQDRSAPERQTPVTKEAPQPAQGTERKRSPAREPEKVREMPGLELEL